MAEHEYHDIPSKPVPVKERLASKRGHNPYTGITQDWPGFVSLGKGFPVKRVGAKGGKMGPLTEENR